MIDRGENKSLKLANGWEVHLFRPPSGRWHIRLCDSPPFFGGPGLQWIEAYWENYPAFNTIDDAVAFARNAISA